MDRGSISLSVRTLYDRLAVAEYLEFISPGTFKYIIYIRCCISIAYFDVYNCFRVA